jgi:hypothetical protein
VRLLQERNRDVARPRLERHAGGEPAVHVVAGRRGVVARRGNLLVAAERRQVHALTVHRDLELLLVLEAAHRAEVGAEQPDLELILAVERQRQVERLPADGADRHPFDVAILRRVLADAEHFAHRRQLGIAERERGDAFRRRQIAFEQHGRHAQHVRVVVEAAARVVGRQHRGRVDAKIEQVAHGVRVFSAVQAMRERPARVRRQPRGAVERRLQVRHERGARIRRRARHTGRRHHAATHLADHLLPDVGVRRCVGKADAIEAEPAGLQTIVVAGDAVGVEGGLERRIGSRRRGLLRARRLRGSGHAQRPHDDGGSRSASHFTDRSVPRKLN